MKKIISICDECGLEVSDISRMEGWISLSNGFHLEIKTKNVHFPSLGCGTRFIEFRDGLEFCSTPCLTRFLNKKLS